MAKVKLNFRRLSVPEKIAKARQIINALTGNTNFSNPTPPLATITASVNALDGAYTTTQSRKQVRQDRGYGSDDIGRRAHPVDVTVLRLCRERGRQ